LAGVVTVRARRAGLSPSATSIRVLTATAISMIAGNIHAVAELYPMARIRSRTSNLISLRKFGLPLGFVGALLFVLVERVIYPHGRIRLFLG